MRILKAIGTGLLVVIIGLMALQLIANIPTENLDRTNEMKLYQL